MNSLVKLAAILWVLYVSYAMSHDGLTGWQSAATLIRPAIFVLMILVAWAAVKVIRSLWRAARRMNVETIGSTAGTLAKAGASHTARFKAAFKTTRDA